VEVLQQSEVRGPKVAEVFPGGDERLLDGLPGSAGRVLGLDLDVCHVNALGIAGLEASAAWPCPGRRDP
jgi:hypothetical protein